MIWKFSALVTILSIALGTAGVGAEEGHYPKRFLIEVTSQGGADNVALRGAIGYDGRLELIEEETPFQKEVQAIGLTAMFAVADPQGEIIAVLYEIKDGKRIKYGDVSGRAVKIVEEPRDPRVTRSFSGF